MKKILLILLIFMLVSCTDSVSKQSPINSPNNNDNSQTDQEQISVEKNIDSEYEVNENDQKKYLDDYFKDDIVIYDYICPPHETFELTDQETGFGLHILLEKKDSIFSIRMDSSPVIIYYGKFEFIDTNIIRFYGDYAINYDFEMKPTDSDLDFRPDVQRSEIDGIVYVDNAGVYLNYGVSSKNDITKNDNNFCKFNFSQTNDDFSNNK